MLTSILNLLIINIIVTIIVDMSDAPSTLKKALTFILTKGKMSRADFRFHLFDCSFCVTFWVSLIFMIVTSQFGLLAIALCLVNALLTTVIKSVLQLTLDILNTIIILTNKLLKLITKI